MHTQKNTSINALDVARHIISFQLLESGLKISHLKLQKLTYYCQAFHLADKDTPLFFQDVIAWQYGPVIKDIYDEYKIYGNAIIPPEESENPESSQNNLHPDALATTAAVLDAYGHLSAIALVDKTHRENPWREAFAKGSGTVIDQQSMRDYYKQFLNK